MWSQTALPLPSPPVFRLLPNDPFLKDVRRVHEEIKRHAYELSLKRGFAPGHELDDWLQAEREVIALAPVEITDLRNELDVKAHLHGFRPEEIEMYYGPSRLYIRATHDVSNEYESARDVFCMVELPCEVDPDRARVTLTRGTVEIIAPKCEVDNAFHPAKIAC